MLSVVFDTYGQKSYNL